MAQSLIPTVENSPNQSFPVRPVTPQMTQIFVASTPSPVYKNKKQPFIQRTNSNSDLPLGGSGIKQKTRTLTQDFSISLPNKPNVNKKRKRESKSKSRKPVSSDDTESESINTESTEYSVQDPEIEACRRRSSLLFNELSSNDNDETKIIEDHSETVLKQQITIEKLTVEATEHKKTISTLQKSNMFLEKRVKELNFFIDKHIPASADKKNI